ncbi:hypothetical protein, partial [Salmonella enterica]|uniref:hypothetical protein n=1 Tax=Salmonella enterica TaxID=28901 RepID=UPI001A9C857D
MRIMIALIVSCLLASCAASSSSTPPSTQTSSGKPACAQCLVCKMNADLACVDVDFDANTPR